MSGADAVLTWLRVGLWLLGAAVVLSYFAVAVPRGLRELTFGPSYEALR